MLGNGAENGIASAAGADAFRSSAWDWESFYCHYSIEDFLSQPERNYHSSHTFSYGYFGTELYFRF